MAKTASYANIRLFVTSLVDCIECFCQVNEASEEIHLLFSTLFVDLSNSIYHVNSATANSETTLGVWKSILCNRVDHPVKDNTCEVHIGKMLTH